MKTLFLDRDGILNIDKNYLYKFEDVEWVDGIFDLIKYANQKNWPVIVLTNQSGIERGFYKKEDVEKLHLQMSSFIWDNYGLAIDNFFYCPYLDGPNRKPNPGMMLKAAEIYDLDLSKCYMVGDKESDALNLAGPQYFLVGENFLIKRPDVCCCRDLHEVLKKIKINEGL